MPKVSRLVVLLVLAVLVPAPGARAGVTTDLTGVVQVASGGQMSCAVLEDTTARCWGTGALGSGNALSETSATAVPVLDGADEPVTGIVQIAVGRSHSCFLDQGGGVACFGENLAGELGDGTTNPAVRPVTVEVADGVPLTGVAEVAVGDVFSCARLLNGQARCWGQNHGALGDGTNADRRRAVVVKNPAGTGPLTGVAEIVAGATSACARLTNGQARCWGDNGSAQLADGTNTIRLRPVAVRTVSGPGNLTGIVDLALDNRTACAALSNSQARCWGANESGQRGTGAATRPGQVLPLRPTAVVALSGTANLAGVAAVGRGGSHSCARLATGQLRCWGFNTAGQVGDGTRTSPRPRPRAVRNPANTANLTGVTSVVAGDQFTCALRTDSTVVCWGANGFGEVGTGSISPRRLLPTVVQT